MFRGLVQPLSKCYGLVINSNVVDGVGFTNKWAIMDQFDVLSWHLSGGTEKNYE